MTASELIKLEPNRVRVSPDLMRLYVSLYADYMGRKPMCAGCSFKTDWNVFVSVVRSGVLPKRTSSETITIKKSMIMSQNFELKRKEGKILFYVKDGRTHRAYDNTASQDFLEAYLKYGKAEEIEERKKLFRKFPKVSEPVKQDKPTAEKQADEKPEPKKRKPRTKKS